VIVKFPKAVMKEMSLLNEPYKNPPGENNHLYKQYLITRLMQMLFFIDNGFPAGTRFTIGLTRLCLSINQAWEGL
jgi:hypothetical protein